MAAGVLWGPADLDAFLAALRHDAIVGEPICDQDGEIIGYRRDSAKMRLFADYAYGKPRKKAAGTPGLTFDPAQLDTLDGCRSAAVKIMQWQMAGRIDDDLAQSLRGTVDLAIKTHTAQSGVDVMDALGDGAELIFAEAGRVKESLAEIGEALEAHDDANES